MNVFVETNFVLELAFEQEQSKSCLDILDLCLAKQITLIIPAFCLTEPLEKLHRQSLNRENLQTELNKEITQLRRNRNYQIRMQSIQDLKNLLIQSNVEERVRFENFRKIILDSVEIIPTSQEILNDATSYEKSPYNLRPQDAIVYASIMSKLKSNISIKSCFLNRNSRDFDVSEIIDELQDFDCRMIPRFDDGYNYITRQIPK